MFSLDNWSYVAAVDYWSNYIEFDELHSTTATAVVSRLKRYFATHGIPIEVVSDNGPQFSSDESKQFSRTWIFQHIATSPYHHQSNGLAESAVKSVKSLLRKSCQGTDIWLVLLTQRNNVISWNDNGTNTTVNE